MKDHAAVLAQLARELRGEVLTDAATLAIYQHDASPCECLPLAVVRPFDAADCQTLLSFARSHHLPLTARGAGTSLAGQSVGEGLVVDFSASMNRILAIDAERKTARVQPGVILADLNRALQGHGLMFAPDPSTLERCNIGGMVGNNSWGIHAIAYGTTRDHLQAARLLLADGTELVCEPLDAVQWQARCCAGGREGEIYRGLKSLLEANLDLIRQAYPTYRGIPNNAGYALDVLAEMQPWQPQGRPFNLAPFLCGSEGSLGLATEFSLRLIKRPTHRAMAVLAYRDLYAALGQVEAALTFPVAALELLDQHVLALAAQQFRAANHAWLCAESPALLVMEMAGEDADLLAEDMRAALQALGQAAAVTAIWRIEEQQIDTVWAIRRAGLQMLMEQPFAERAVTGIEDSAVAVSDLPEYVRQVHELLASYRLDSVNYGPVSMGGLHIRPRLNRSATDLAPDIEALLQALAEIVARFGGTLSAKHGDGRLRGALISQTLGLPVVELLQEVRQLFDAEGIMNPLPLG